MKTASVIQSNYIPWIGYFAMINDSDLFVLYEDVQYTKNDWRNRNLIKTPNGLEWLTIPVNQKNLEQKINETCVSQNNWNKKHWNTLVGNYSKAPFFKRYSEEFKDLFLGIETDNLSENNLIFIKKINSLFEINTEIIDSQSLQLIGDKNERLIEAVKKLNGTHYISGPAAKSYLNIEAFEKEEIHVEWMDYSNYPEYPQMFSPFKHNVTILDLLFNVGPDAKKFLNK